MALFKKKEDEFNENEAKKLELEACYERLGELMPETDEYKEIVRRITDLHETDKKRVDPNTVVSGLFSTIPVIGIIVYEGFGNVIKTKAISFISKIRL